MKYVLVPISVLLFVSSYGAAQVNTSVSSGSKAVLFSFNGLDVLNAGAFKGGFGGKYFLSNQLAIRGGLQLGFASETIPANPGPGGASVDGNISASTFGLNGAVEYHLTSQRVSPYLGGGAELSFTRTQSKSAEVGNPPPAQTVVQDRIGGENIDGVTYNPGTLFGVYGILGVEFFIVDDLSLSAEYHLGISFTSQPDQQVTTGNTTVTTIGGSSSEFGIGTGGMLTLAVYF
jgi:hypothetical protein